MVAGKDVRLARLLENGRMLCVPMDHGVTVGPVGGLRQIRATIAKIDAGGATAILAHKGVFRALTRPVRAGLIIHVNASTTVGPSPNRKLLVTSVEEAIRLGADAVSVHVNVGAKEEPEMLVDLGRTADACDAWGIPLIAMMYPRGESVRDPHDPTIVAHAARIGAELGADLVKTVYTGNPESFRDVVSGCPVPIVIAGGPRVESEQALLEMAAGALQAGAIGVTFGRNIFDHSNPTAILQALRQVVIFDRAPTDALRHLEARPA